MILGLAAQAILLMHLRRQARRADEMIALGWSEAEPQELFGAPLTLVILAARLGIWDLKARRGR